MTSKGVLVIAAPLLIAAYGVVRYFGIKDGRYGPGLDWQAGHLLGLAGMVLFIPAVLFIASRLPRTRWRTAAVSITLVGLAASIVQFGADVVEAAMAADKAELRALSRQFTSIPGVEAAFYSVGPQLFFVGLVLLTVLLATTRRVPWWSPVLMLVGVGLPPVTLDLIPIAGVLIAASLLPAAIGEKRPARRTVSDQMVPR